MKYSKPEVTKMQPAVEAIQSDQVKTIRKVLDSQMVLAATSAYEADE